MKSANLEVTNNKGSTALHYAAFAGNKEVARMMVEKNYRLPGIPNKTGVTPLYMAVLSSHYETTEFLLGLDKFESQTAAYGCTILNLCIENDLIGIALELVNRFDFLAVAKDENNEGPLVVLARNPSAFVGDGGGGQLRWWHRIIYYRMRRKSPATKVNLLLHKIWQQVEDQRHIQNAPTEDIAKLLFVAAERGNYEFLVDLLRRHPEILYLVNESEHTIFHIAVLNRFEPIFSLIFEIRSLQSLVAVSRQSDGSTMLHLAARLAPSSQLDTLPGPALQIHRELLWYKEVEKIVPASYRRMKDGNKRIPHDLFIEEHRELTKKGELWMMTTAQPFTVVAALIATVLFTTTFSIPGGIEDKTGFPILLKERLSQVFMVSEIVGMLSSFTSVIMFLCIPTARYAEEDFIRSLPFWLLTGITMFFISVAAMMVAFFSSFFLFDPHRLANIPTFLGLFAMVPLMFIWFKYPLLADILSSAYGTKFMFQSRKRLFST